MPTLSQKHSNRFHKDVSNWLELFKLADWEVHYMFCEDKVDELADCTTTTQNKQALIRLYSEWDIDPTPEALDQTACHEVLHVLFAQLMQLAADRYVTDKQLADAEHDVIRALERVLF